MTLDPCQLSYSILKIPTQKNPHWKCYFVKSQGDANLHSMNSCPTSLNWCVIGWKRVETSPAKWCYHTAHGTSLENY